MFNAQNSILLVTVLLTALITGLFYGWACSVIPGTARLGDHDYFKTMKSLNREILNPWFFMSFMGTLIALPVCTWYCYGHFSSSCFYFMLAATLFYTIGGFGLTMTCNVPLNNVLDAFDPTTASDAEIHAQRINFEIPWNKYHMVRTLACIGSLACTIVAIIKK